MFMNIQKHTKRQVSLMLLPGCMQGWLDRPCCLTAFLWQSHVSYIHPQSLESAISLLFPPSKRAENTWKLFDCMPLIPSDTYSNLAIGKQMYLT